MLVLFFGIASLLFPVEPIVAPLPGAPPDVLPARVTAPELTSVPEVYRPEKAAFAVRAGETVVPYRAMGLFVMPGERVELDPVLAAGTSGFAIEAEGGDVTPRGENAWTWTAPPTPGVYPIRITDAQTGEHIRLNAFVKRPYDPGREVLNGYRIGRYERALYQGNPIYRLPEGFIEVTPENRDVLVSPHFTLGEFVARQTSGYPRYMLLDERLLMKLEILLEHLNARGIQANTLHVMSGYRTPFYNRSIGNETSYSLHVYGAAADVFVDMDGDGHMDDLTGDGRVTRADAELLADIVEDIQTDDRYQPFIGGLGIYSPAPHRGPFVHVDVRGHPARW